MKRIVAFMAASLLASTVAAAAATPTVKMSVTTPDGQTSEIAAPESGLATVTLKDGTEIGIRPTILDAKPWSHVVLTFFKMPTSAHASEEFGTVEVRTGAPAVQTKTTPSFKVAVTSVSDGAAPQPNTTR